jgi:hypothetical protein
MILFRTLPCAILCSVYELLARKLLQNIVPYTKFKPKPVQRYI